MNEAAGVDVEDLWACASAEGLQRTVDLARRILAASTAVISSVRDGSTVLRAQSGETDPAALVAIADICHALVAAGSPCLLSDVPVNAFGQGQPATVVAVPIRLAGRPDIGILCAMDVVPRDWAEADLGDVAASLASQIELKHEVLRHRRAEAALGAKMRLATVADHIPGLVFERRKVDAARSRYVFFGSAKTALPAVRQMMEHGASGDFNFVHRDDREAVRAAILRSNLEETDLDLTFRIKELDGSIRWVRSQSIVRHETDGSVCWDGLCFDVTDLVAARESAEAAHAARSDVLVGLDHRVHAPLEAIGQLTQFLETERHPDLVAVHARGIRAAVESLRGVVDEMRLAGEGSRRDEIDPDAVRARSAAAEALPIRILLADDLDLNRKLIADMLSIEGHIVDCVSDGVEAVTAASQRPYDLILMDMIMPGMDGIAATRAIRALPGPAAKVPIVALTANSFQEQLDSCLKAGMDATLTKPMSIDALTEAVHTWTHGRHQAA